MTEIIEIDGSYLEGGGQILRTSCALAAITQKACRVFNIRKNRPKPGLMPQHLLGLRALAQLCNADLEGDLIGSSEIQLAPREISAKDLKVKIETAGSITLVLQTLLLPALFAPEAVKISFDGGATDTFFAPTIDYLRYVFLKNLERIGIKTEINILKRGYYPEGGARVEMKVFPVKNIMKKLGSLNWTECGPLKRILAVSGASVFLKDKKVAERQLTGIKEILGKLKLPLEEKVEYYPTQNPGSQICLAAEFEKTIVGSDNLGKLGKRAEEIGREAAQNLLQEARSGACLDKHAADQILPFMALTGAQSQVTISAFTPHCQTNVWAIEKFLKGQFKIESKGNYHLITWLPADTP